MPTPCLHSKPKFKPSGRRFCSPTAASEAEAKGKPTTTTTTSANHLSRVLLRSGSDIATCRRLMLLLLLL